MIQSSFGYEKGHPVPTLGGSFVAGFFASACSLPFDYVKTQLQSACVSDWAKTQLLSVHASDDGKTQLQIVCI